VDAPRGDHAATGVIHPADGRAFPSTHPGFSAVSVQFVAGYGDATDVPAGIKHAVLLIVGDLYENRENAAPRGASSLPLTAERLLWPYRALEFA